MDDQLSKSNVSGKEESFVWDDLALIQRNSTELTNEPYVTGGNPILAGDKALFNDMLGSTLGVAANGSYTPINRTSFGEVDNASSSDYNFFTGKPNVDGLGYSFLFRNYNADNGKWLSQDPFGYPDGYNNFAYVNNKNLSCIDPWGLAAQMILFTDADRIAAGNNITPPPGTFVVDAHGNTVTHQVMYPTGVSLDASTLANLIVSSGQYVKGQSVILACCQISDAYAAQLAMAIQQFTQTPCSVISAGINNNVYVYPNGTVTKGTTAANATVWIKNGVLYE